MNQTRATRATSAGLAGLVALSVALLALAAPASAAAPQEPDCYQVYREIVAGPPVSVTLVNSCILEVEATTGGACFDRYREYDFGTVQYVSRDSCHHLVRITTTAPDFISVQKPPVHCLPYYTEYDLGVVVVRMDGCGGPSVRPGAIATGADDPMCMERYQEVEAGPVTIVSRSSCEYEVLLNGQPVGDGLLGPDGGPEENCLYYYYDYNLGAVRYEMVSSCESHLWVAGEQVF